MALLSGLICLALVHFLNGIIKHGWRAQWYYYEVLAQLESNGVCRCVRKAIHSINSFRFGFSLSLSLSLLCKESAWQQMNANEQNDFRIVSVNLYAIKNNFALNQLWLFWIDRHCCAVLSWAGAADPTSHLSLLLRCCSCHFLEIQRNGLVSAPVFKQSQQKCQKRREQKKWTQEHPTHANETKLTGCLMYLKYIHIICCCAHTSNPPPGINHQPSPSYMSAH